MTQEEMIQELWTRQRIERLLLRFGRALDLGDWAAYRACFTDHIDVDFERLTGCPEIRIDADLWTRFAELALTPVRRHHQYSNIAIDIDPAGDRATAVVYMVARHWKATDIGASENTQYGWYNFDLIRQGEDWRIARLRHDFQWIAGNGALLDFAEPELARVMGEVFRADNQVRR